MCVDEPSCHLKRGKTQACTEIVIAVLSAQPLVRPRILDGCFITYSPERISREKLPRIRRAPPPPGNSQGGLSCGEVLCEELFRETVNQEGRLEKSDQYEEFLSQSVLARAGAYRSKYQGVSVTGTLARFSLSPLVDTPLHVQPAPSVSSL